MSDLMEEIHRQDAEADGLLVGRQTFEDLRGYWPQQTDDTTGITNYLNDVEKYVVSSTMTDPRRSPAQSGTPSRLLSARRVSCQVIVHEELRPYSASAFRSLSDPDVVPTWVRGRSWNAS